jgi:hypothetical protein
MKGQTRAAVADLLAIGLTQSQIATELGIARPTVCFHARSLGVPRRAELANRFDWATIRKFYDDGHSVRERQQKFGFSRAAWANAVTRGDVTPRPRLEPTENLLAPGRRRCRTHIKVRLVRAGLKTSACEECGIQCWRGRPLSFELHHVNGDGSDNRLENLRLLCPNCHSQTDNWGGRNRGRRRST